MKRKGMLAAIVVGAIGLLLAVTDYAFAHCDGLDGPVVNAARKALVTRNVNYVLVWVQKQNEPELRAVFQQTLAVRKLNPESQALADRNLFETVVRLHRAGEGAPYNGLQPAGRDLGPAIPAADRAIESGDLDDVEQLLVKDVRSGLAEAFASVKARRNYEPNDLFAGREYVKAYVEYVHYVERLHEAASRATAGHYAETAAH